MVTRSIIEVVHRYLEELEMQGLPVTQAVLFGSHVKGTSHAWSDIDLIVVSPRFDGKRQRQDVDLLWHTIIDIDSRIQPIPCGTRQWMEDDSSAIIEIARREGKVIHSSMISEAQL
jgi:uncharacterized protein